MYSSIILTVTGELFGSSCLKEEAPSKFRRSQIWVGSCSLVICNLFISHGLSWKVSEAIKNVKSKKVIIIDDINTDLIINNIYNAIRQYEDKETSN